MGRRRDLLEKALASGDPGKVLAPHISPDAIGIKESMSDADKLLDDVVGCVEVYRVMCRRSNGGHATFIDKVYGTMKGRQRISDENRRRLVKAICDISARKVRDRFDAAYGPLVIGGLRESLSALESYLAERPVRPLWMVVARNIDYRKRLRDLEAGMRDAAKMEGDRARVIENLRRVMDLDIPGVRIHLLKDLYTMEVERAYYQTTCRIMRRLAYLDDDRGRVARTAETLMSVRGPVEKGDGTLRSDLREIRNAFAHPAGIDMGDHYRIRLSPGRVLDLYDTDLLFHVFMVEFLAQEMDMVVDVMVSVELYCRYREEF